MHLAHGVCLTLQAAEEERGLNEAQQAAEDEEALRAMREEGMLTDQPDPGLPKPGVPSGTDFWV